MPRVKLTELQSYEFQYDLTVRATEINYAGHLGNEALLALVHEARAVLLRQLNFLTLVRDSQRVGLTIADLAINFIAEAFAHDQLVVDSQISELRKKSFRLFHRIRRSEKSIALIETGLVAFDYQTRQVVPLPENFITGLQNYRNIR